MGFSYSKRLTALRQQTDESLEGRFGLLRVFFLFVLGLSFVTFLYSTIVGPDVQPNAKGQPPSWSEIIQQDYTRRLTWLQTSPFSVAPGASRLYSGWSTGVISILDIKKSDLNSTTFLSLLFWRENLKRRLAGSLLRSGFVLFAFWPFWILGFIIGSTALKKTFRPKKTDDFLGVCDRGRTPFYSGIYGPLRSNNNLSGIDYSAPGLACPNLAPEAEASSHKLASVLQSFQAKNATNIDLIRVILQYRDFPCLVETEMSTQEAEPTDSIERQIASSIIPFVTNAGGTIEQSALIGLPATLEAHAILARYVRMLEEKKITTHDLNFIFGKHLEMLRSIAKPSSSLVAQLLFSLTPNRAVAIGRLPAHIVATAYLSTEAGKCLVFRRQDKGFHKISHYPHLQARAILQSLVSFHKEHKGEARLFIRQAIISSRRHGDFGRAFLPERMTIESRGLRDWLEILYSEPAKREQTAQMVELDAHVEEIGINWRIGYSKKMRAWAEQEELRAGPEEPAGPPYPFWKGVVYKSVILMPVSDLVSLALRGIDEARITRMNDLIKLTRRTQFNLSVMARLPGFKRQALEAQQGGGESNPYFTNGRQELLKRWTVVRKMLTHYNWLSTRVGDHSVPFDGLIHSIVSFPDEVNPQNRLFAFEAMVPFRQRRCDELLGKQWEQNYYFDSPHPSCVDVFVDRPKYLEAVAVRASGNFQKLGQARTGRVDEAPQAGATPGNPKGPAVASG